MDINKKEIIIKSDSISKEYKTGELPLTVFKKLILK